MSHVNWIAMALTLFISAPLLRGGDEAAVVSDGKRDAQGFVVYEVISAYEAGATEIRVLRPEKLDHGRRYSVVYVLPVEAKDGERFGDGLREVKRLDLQNRYQTFFVAPTFSHLPWYADHPTDSTIRQESYFLKMAVPFIEKTYPVRQDPPGRLLLGFSKSGWGAFSLLLRHPDLFGKAAAWDAPLAMDRPGRYGSGDVFATQENFDRYRITTLLELRANALGPDNRLILLGYGNFRDDHREVHALMQKLKIPHAFADGPQRKHEWGSGWLPEAVDLLSPPKPTAAATTAASRPAPRKDN